MNKPKIYGTCPAGCLWETVHMEDFLKSASHYELSRDSDGFFPLQRKRLYKIFAPLNLNETFNCAVSYKYRISGNNAVYGIEIDLPTGDAYAEFFTLRLVHDEVSSYDEETHAITVVYEINGVRYTVTKTIESSPLPILLEDNCLEIEDTAAKTQVFIYNKDATIEAKDGKSAYEIAVDHGFYGTEEEWLDWLKQAKDGKSAYAYAQENGYTGTEAEFAEGINPDKINENSHKYIVDELAQRNQLRPEFANDIAECVDSSTVYVLPDGFLYAYGKVERVVQDNQFGSGYLLNKRVGSSGDVSSTGQNGMVVTNEITIPDYVNPYTVTISGVTLVKPSGYDYTVFCTLYNSSGSKVGGFSHTPTLNSDGKYVIDIYSSSISDVGSVRFNINISTTAITDADVANLFIDFEPKDGVVTGYEWANTGHAFVPADYDDMVADLSERTNRLELDVYEIKQNGVETDNEDEETDSIPEYWEEHLAGKIASIKALQQSGGKNCFSFISIADMHEEQNLGRFTGLLARRIMDECSIKFALALGDITTRNSAATEAKLVESFESAFDILKPILGDTLLAQGNHDGAYNDANGNVYASNLSNEQIYDIMFRRVGLVGNVHFCDDGMGYYIDDTASRVRYVILNPHNKLGTPNNYFHTYRYGQAQFDLMVEALTTMPKDDWSVLFASHIPPVTEIDRHGDGVIEANMADSVPEQTLLRNLVEAFMNRTVSFSGSYGTRGAWDYVSLTGIDFSGAKGNFIGYFAGHLHADCLFSGGIYNFPVITSRCDSYNENVFSDNGTDVDEQLREERVKGTATEQSFDVFTVNKSTRTIYATKIGAGADREIDY